MVGARKVCSVLTSFAFLLQTLILPLAGNAQTPKRSQVLVCVPQDLVTKEWWTYPYPGSEIDVFKKLLANYILAHGDPRVQYRIKADAFETFKRARRASAPYTPDSRSLLEEVSAGQTCPPANYPNTLEVPAKQGSPNSLDPVVTGIAAAVLAETPTRKDGAQPTCDQLADNPYDPQKVGRGVPFDQINVGEALPVCEQAAKRQPPQARYQFLYGRVLEAANRHADAAQEYSRAEQAGYAMAACNLGRLYITGQGVSSDLQKAANLYRKGANAGLAVGFYGLGQLYDLGKGAPKDWGEAAKWYQKAGDAGYPDGYADLAHLYARSNPPNHGEAFKWSQKAAQGGSAWGSSQLGWHYQYGAAVNKDLVSAKSWYERAANQGLADAMYRLGLMYRIGEGIPSAPATAAQWMYQAAKRSHHFAEAELGNMFYNGQGTQKDDQAAFGWYLLAAQAGIVQAQNSLAALYELGQGVAKNEIKAVTWYRAAAAQGDAYAMYQLGLHLRRGSGVAWSEAEAMDWFKKAAAKGLAEAEWAVGYGYKEGLGESAGQGKQDFHLAAEWLARAVQHGSDAALIELAWLYYKGWGVERDPQRAQSLYRQASNSRYPNVAAMAKLMLQEDTDTVTRQTRPSGSSSETSDWVPWVVGGGILLAYLMSGPSSRQSASAPPSSTDSSFSYSSDSYSSGNDTSWSSSASYSEPSYRQVRDSSSFMTPNGLDLSNPTHGGASTHRERQ